jgi:hypothetical protein
VIGESVVCAREECGKEFNKSTSNQIYCCSSCTRIETNRKIMERYYERAAIKRGVVRHCHKCNARLSRYNEDKICAPCQSARDKERNKAAENIFNSVDWI